MPVSKNRRFSANKTPFTWDNVQTLSETEQGTEKWVVQLVSKNRGASYVSIRKWWLDSTTDPTTPTYKPGRQGMTLHYEVVPHVINQLGFALEVLSKQDWKVKAESTNTMTTIPDEEQPQSGNDYGTPEA